mmetsp:Transcript_5322/g.6076  ORF Transcript_5322/g.6076 Transcript_5322/m.6076 type:complete len:792 (-) Transcript_5322:523-2898(-)
MYSSRSNSSVETLNPLIKPATMFNIIPNSSHPHLPRTRSEPISNIEKLSMLEVFKDAKTDLLVSSSVSKFSLDGDCDFSQLTEFQEKSTNIENIQSRSKVSNLRNTITLDNSKSALTFVGDALWIIEDEKRSVGLNEVNKFCAADSHTDDRDSLIRLLEDSDYSRNEQVLSPQESTYALTTSDYISPIPALTFSPQDKSNATQKYKLQKALEELIESEEHYVVSLTLLLNYYLEPLVSDNIYKCGLPLIIITNLVSVLIESHTNMLQQLRLLCQYPRSHGSESSIVHVATEVAKSIFDIGINVPIYEEYCNVYESVLKIMKDSKHMNSKYKKESNQTWVKGWKNYLEATQPISKRMDLSFISLVQKPISRVAKYGLIIESLSKYSGTNNSISMYCNLVKSKLNDLNDNSRGFIMNDKSIKINDLLNFEGTSLGIQLTLEFFGKCLMIGSLTIVWIENDNEKSGTMGVFLYKSHLIMSDISTRKNVKNEIKFIIPLSVCNLFSDPKECDGGLYSKYPYTMKILFEHQYCQYEILIISINKKEQDIWGDYLDTLINHVNGPFKLGYTSTDGAKLMILYPKSIIPYDVSLLKVSTYRKFKDYCYFKTPISLNVMIEFPISQETKQNKYVLTEEGNQSMFYPQTYSHTILIVITKIERATAEINLSSIWSKELPLIFPNFQANKNKPTIKKSSSWSQLKMGMGSIRGLRTSHSYSEGINSLRLQTQDNVEQNHEEFSKLVKDSRKFEAAETVETDKTITSDTEIKRINSKSFKFKNAVLGLFQISRSSSIKMTTS